MIDPDSAQNLVIERSSPAAKARVAIDHALGLTLAEPIRSDRDYPPFDRAMMDGFAVVVSDAGRTVSVVGEVAAGDLPKSAVTRGHAVEIMTGAPCPEGTEAVAPKEDARRDGDCVLLPPELRAGQNIAPRGSECAAGTVVLDVGDVITPLALASIVTFGYENVRVFPRPTLAIITTGNELVAPGAMPGPSQIRNSNGPMLTAYVRSMQVEPMLVTHARDTVGEFRRALAMAADADFIVLSGAVSEGKFDVVPQALEQFGATTVFHKVSQRPGKPILFATRGSQLIFGLPGNPLSCQLGFHRYIGPAIRKFMGRPALPPRYSGILAEPFAMKGPRTLFQLSRAECDGGQWRITPLKGKGSADLYSAARANALARFEPGAGILEAGAPINFEMTLPLPP